MQTVYLNGDISKFGEKWSVSCKTIPEIFKLIDCQTPGFRQYLIEAAENGIGYEVRRGEEFIDEETVLLSLGKEDIIITEIPAGAKSGGAKIITAMAIAALLIINPASIFTATTLMPAGAGFGVSNVAVATGLNMAGLALAGVATNLAISGLAQLIAPGPEVDSAESNESYLFNGPVNNIKQGLPVPVAYGELIVGGAPISVSYSTTDPTKNSFAVAGSRPSNPYFNQEGVDYDSTSAVDPGEACFTSTSLVTLHDGSKKEIQNIVVGDVLKGQSGPAEVLEVKPSRAEHRLYSINQHSHFVTDCHPFLTTEGWKAFNAPIAKRIHPELNITSLQIGDVLVKETGTEVLEKFTKVYKECVVFNLDVSGNDTYIVNDFIVHNK